MTANPPQPIGDYIIMKPTVSLVGNLTADCVHIFSNEDGSARRCLFTVACNSVHGEGENRVKEVDYFQCIAWGKLVDMLKTWGLKGRKVHINGELEAFQAPINEDGTYPPSKVQIRVDRVEFCNLEDNVKALLNQRAEAAKVSPTTEAPSAEAKILLDALAQLLMKG